MSKSELPFGIPFDKLVERKERQTGRTYTQQQLAQEIGIAINTLRAWRDDTVKHYDRITLGKIADFFGVEPSVLFGFSESEEGNASGYRMSV
jgi:transcriptional regulator with XRE-family HTH domain